jgi:hypothetical protein
MGEQEGRRGEGSGQAEDGSVRCAERAGCEQWVAPTCALPAQRAQGRGGAGTGTHGASSPSENGCSAPVAVTWSMMAHDSPSRRSVSRAEARGPLRR